MSMRQFGIFGISACDLDIEEGKIVLEYLLDDPEDGGSKIHFTETLHFPPPEKINPERRPELERALTTLHIIGGISYYKTCLPPVIEVRSGTLSKDEAAFYQSVYENGLGEFYTRNDIDPRKHAARFMGASEAHIPATRNPQPATRNPLVPIGGGKDSIVTIELLKKAGIFPTLLRIGSHPVITKTAGIAGLPLIEVKRSLAPELFELNEVGALNGHVPISAYLAALGAVLAILFEYDSVIFSNENSANEENLEYFGRRINHQWSKSLEFEDALQKHLKESVQTPVDVFSLLRPFNELRITNYFSRFSQYFSVVTSCNTNWKIKKSAKKEEKSQTLWCGKCPKCAFVFVMMNAFLETDQVTKMFGKDLLDDEALLPLYKELLGIEGHKPFECVGTPDETKAALLLVMERDKKSRKILEFFKKEVLPSIKNPKDFAASVFKETTEHRIPERYVPVISSLS